MIIIVYLHLPLQFTYELFHTCIYFTPFHSSREISTQQVDLATNVWHHSSVGRALHWYSRISRVRIPLKPDFFRLLLSNCLNWKIYCNDHSSLSSTTAGHIWIISYIVHATFNMYIIIYMYMLWFKLKFRLRFFFVQPQFAIL